MKTFPQSPYFDDFSENKKFYQVLTRPSYPLQARELQTIQSILQRQIESIGNHFFKEGAKIIDGQMSFDTDVTYVKIKDGYTTNLERLVGTTLTGNYTGAKANVVAVSLPENGDPATLFVKFVSSDTKNFSDSWSLGEVITEYNDIQIDNAKDAIGKGSIATIERGVYYIKGYFVLVEAQSIVLDKYSNVPSYRVGLTVNESVITPEMDSSLLDNAMGSSNYSAPGAHRYHIDLVLTKVTLSDKTDSDNFVELGQIQSGRIVKQVTTTEYNELEATLARRTYDESGDYTVKPFKVSVREHRNNDRGQWKANTFYKMGDIVKNFGNAYVAKTEGTSGSSSTGPLAISGTDTTDNVEWEYVAKPDFNNGVYSAEGKLSKIEILDGGNGYIVPPIVEITADNNQGSGAEATAVVSEGKVVDIIIDNHGSGYTDQTLKVTFRGGHASATDPSVDSSQEAIATAIAYTDAGNSDMLSIGIEGGKAYVQGFELEKMGTTWVNVKKSRQLDVAKNVIVVPSVGNYFRITNLGGKIPPIAEGQDNVVEMFDTMIASDGGNVVGTARIRGIEPDSNGVYKLFVYDIVMEQGKSIATDVKRFECKNGFRADIEPVLTLLTGNIKTSGTGKNVTITGSGTTFITELRDGDYIKCGTAFVEVNDTTIAQNSFTANVYGDKFADNSVFYRVTTELCEPQGTSAVYDLPHSHVINTDIGEVDFYVTAIDSEKCDSNGILRFNCGANATFANPQDDDNYILLNSSGVPVEYELDEEYKSGSSNISFKLKNFNGKQEEYTLIATVHKLGIEVGLGHKLSASKIIRKYNREEVTSNTIMLGEVDAYKLVSVKMYPNLEFGSAFVENTNYIDITDRYNFHDGQTSSYYGESYITLKGGYSAPEHPITIEFFYFERTDDGFYYTVNSYDTENDIEYKDIPSYNGRRLSDVIDFRPDLDKSGIPSRSSMVKRGTEIQISYNYYLARKDKICIDYLGNIFAVEGISSLNPEVPDSPSLSMDICNVELTPYTFDATVDNVNIELIDNKRYTMRDIGRLDKRIAKLEEYTTLSLLEVQTEALVIKDAEGYDRFKNGFVVDNFSSTLLLNNEDEGCNCAIDAEHGICRPPFVTNNVSLVEYLGTDSSRDESNYMLYGKLFTLPLDVTTPHVPIVEQPIATQIQNVNPFAIVSFVGSLSVNPSSDDWYETKYLPDIINNVEGNYLSTKKALEGTKWNSWQVSWTGAKVQTGQTTSTRSTGRAGRDLTTYTTTTTTYAQQQGQTRSGVKTTVSATTDYELVGDRLVSTTNIPYMRSRWLLVRAFNLKPYTRYYPKFDGVDVDYWCVPASKIEYHSERGVFDSTSGAGYDATSNARKIVTTKNSYWAETTDRTCLDVGDVIVGRSSGCTAVVVGNSYCTTETNRNNYSKCLYVVNIKSASGKPQEGRSYKNGVLEAEGLGFTEGETISALNSISGASAVVGATHEGNKNHKYDNLVTNSSGELYFMFWIPDVDMVDYTGVESDVPVFQFKCGDRVLSLHEDANASSNGDAVYSAVGILNTRQKSINAVRNAVVTTQTVSENRTITNTSSTTNTVKRYLDPLAQTFVIGDAVTGGCFLSKVDIYFATKPTNENPLPITLQIRTVENGIPTGKVLPFSTVTLRPDQVNISNNMVTYVDETGTSITTSTFDTPTTFVFDSPVYVEDTSEYAIVLLSDSNEYNVWIAQLGATIPGKETIVSKQPHMGVLFKSQNASTWSPAQNQDLMFTLYRANFKVGDTSTKSKYIGNVKFASQPLPKRYLAKNSIETTKDSSIIRVWDSNHGLLEGMEVAFEVDDINDVDNNNYLTGTINVSKELTYVRGYGTRFLYELKQNDTIYSDVGKELGTVATISNNNELYLKANGLESVDGVNYSKQIDEETLNGISYNTLLQNKYRVINADFESYTIDVGESAEVGGYCGKSTLKVNYVLNYDLIQPNFTAQNFSDTSMTYKLKTVYGTSSGSSTQESTDFYQIVENESNELITPMAIYSDVNRLKSKKNEPSLIFSVDMSSSNSCLTPVIDTDRMSAILVNNIINKPKETDIVVPETNPTGGSIIAKYITKPVSLAYACNYIRIMMAMCVPQTSDVEVYYKTYQNGGGKQYEDVEWKLATPTESIKRVEIGSDIFTDVEYNVEYDENDKSVPSFDVIAVKVVFIGSNSCAVPKIKDLRIIACD